MTLVDVVVVSYNSAGTLRACVEPLVRTDWVDVTVVDNASADSGLEAIADLPITIMPLEHNFGFAYGCNRGWETGRAPYVLFLNPDARMEPDSLHRLVRALEERPSAGLLAPRTIGPEGALDYSQRRFARLRSTYAQALFLHRIFPFADWTDQVVRDSSAYETAHPVEWVTGACMLVRRRALEEIGGWDERFFLYGEDQDLCRRLWTAGYEVRFDPSAQAVHVGGASAPRAELLPVLASSRIRYAERHRGRLAAAAERLGVGLGALAHAMLTTKGGGWRGGYFRALQVAVCPARETAWPSALGVPLPSTPPTAYGLITPARDESENLRRLGASLVGQTLEPAAWIIVENGSTDDTLDVARSFADQHGWIRVISSRDTTDHFGRSIVGALHTGLEHIGPVDVVVKLDADVSMGSDYFERLLSAFAADPLLGIASGVCLERRDGTWQPTRVTGAHVRGAVRAWRRECLEAILPLDDSVDCAVDTVDELKAASLGWRTGIVPELSFYHHRSVGERDGAPWTRTLRQGRAAYYLGYRFWYLTARSAFRAPGNPAAIAMIAGYLAAWARREPRCSDRAVVRHLRRQQSLRSLPVRVRQALGGAPGRMERAARASYDPRFQSATLPARKGL